MNSLRSALTAVLAGLKIHRSGRRGTAKVVTGANTKQKKLDSSLTDRPSHGSSQRTSFAGFASLRDDSGCTALHLQIAASLSSTDMTRRYSPSECSVRTALR